MIIQYKTIKYTNKKTCLRTSLCHVTNNRRMQKLRIQTDDPKPLQTKSQHPHDFGTKCNKGHCLTA